MSEAEPKRSEAEPKRQEAFFYTEETFHLAPARLRELDQIPLRYDQANRIVADAYDKQFLQHGSWIPSWGEARDNFRIFNHIENGIWVEVPPVEETSKRSDA